MNSDRKVTKVALSAIPYLYIVRGVLDQFKLDHPEMEVIEERHNSEQALSMVVRGEAPIGVVAHVSNGFSDKQYETMTIGRDKIILAVPATHWLASRKTRQVRKALIVRAVEALDVMVALRETGSGTREVVLSFFGQEAQVLLQHEESRIFESNEEVLTCVRQSANNPIKILGFVSTVVCDGLGAASIEDLCLLDIDGMEPRDFVAVRKNENQESEPLWSYLKQHFDLGTCLEHIVEIVEEKTRQHLPVEYLLGKKYLCHYYASDDTVCFRIIPGSASGGQKVVSHRNIRELESLIWPKYPWYNLHLAVLRKAVCQTRKIPRGQIIGTPRAIANRLSEEITMCEIRTKRAEACLLLLIGAVIGAGFAELFRFIVTLLSRPH